MIRKIIYIIIVIISSLLFAVDSIKLKNQKLEINKLQTEVENLNYQLNQCRLMWIKG